MGFTGLARWVNAPTTGLEIIKENIIRNHNAQLRGKWSISVRSYRSTFGPTIPVERSMCALTMGDQVFVLLEDPVAPARADIPDVNQQPQPPVESQTPGGTSHHHQIKIIPHHRNSYITIRPPGAFEQLLGQLRARWTSTRGSNSSGTINASQRGQQVGNQLTIEGFVFAIGNDWLVRVGNVILGSGGAVKGMLLEAEYLPLPLLRTESTDGTSDLLSNLLTSILPNFRDAKMNAVGISDDQWREVLWDRDEEEESARRKAAAAKEEEQADDDDDDIFGKDDDADSQPGDWHGVERDRRSAFLIIGALKQEGLL